MVDNLFNSKTFQLHQLFQFDGFKSFCQHVYPALKVDMEQGADQSDELADLLANPSAVLRDSLPAHLTTSSVVLDPSASACVLLMHRKIGEWVYPGGHADGDWHLLRSALRECFEETALEEVRVLPPAAQVNDDCVSLRPHLVQRFRIRASGAVAEHTHYDCVFVFQALSREMKFNPDESSDIRWYPVGDLEAVAQGEEGQLVDGLDPLTAKICLTAMQSALGLSTKSACDIDHPKELV